MASFQVPAGILAERRGEARLLAAGTAVTALGFLAAGLTGGFPALLVCLLWAGSAPAASTRCPPRSCRRPTRRGRGGRRSAPITSRATSARSRPRRGGARCPGSAGAAPSRATPRSASSRRPRSSRCSVAWAPAARGARARERGRPPAARGWGIRDPRAYRALSAIHVIDNSTRTGFLTFLPFLLIAKGATVRSVGLALMLVFIGGAIGKFACGALADRVGVIRTVVVTEAATGAGILLLLTLPLAACLVALPPLGIALNGPRSVLYGTVADLVSSDRRARSYAIFYTLGIGASALSPFAYGLLSDGAGVRVTLTVVGLVVFLTLPFTLPLRQPLTVASPQSA